MKAALKRAIAKRGFRISRLTPDERALLDGYDPRRQPPSELAEVLTPSNPRLKELERAYRTFDDPVNSHTQWGAELTSDVTDLWFFRGDNSYLWQYTRSPELNRLRTYVFATYVRRIDAGGWLGGALREDGAFGCITVDFDTLGVVSRDLLDSVNELSFLDRQDLLGGSPTVLDIGAGYGRLAHRALAAAPAIERYYCIDAIPRSTFLCEAYVRHRGIEDRCVVLPLTEMSSVSAGDVDLAVNVHSFSEMPERAIRGWVEWLARLEVPALFVVPNDRDRVLSSEEDGTRRDCSHVLADAGFELTLSEPTIDDPDVRDLLDIHDQFMLFRRSPAPLGG